jgi:hypothetical protein
MRLLQTIGFCLICHHAHAEMSATEAIEKFKAGDSAAMVMLSGIALGLSAANSALRIEHKSPVFCVPEKLEPLIVGQQVGILTNYISDGREPLGRSLPISAMMVVALMDAFPCPLK